MAFTEAPQQSYHDNSLHYATWTCNIRGETGPGHHGYMLDWHGTIPLTCGPHDLIISIMAYNRVRELS